MQRLFPLSAIIACLKQFFLYYRNKILIAFVNILVCHGRAEMLFDVGGQHALKVLIFLRREQANYKNLEKRIAGFNFKTMESTSRAFKGGREGGVQARKTGRGACASCFPLNPLPFIIDCHMVSRTVHQNGYGFSWRAIPNSLLTKARNTRLPYCSAPSLRMANSASKMS